MQLNQLCSNIYMSRRMMREQGAHHQPGSLSINDEEVIIHNFNINALKRISYHSVGWTTRIQTNSCLFLNIQTATIRLVKLLRSTIFGLPVFICQCQVSACVLNSRNDYVFELVDDVFNKCTATGHCVGSWTAAVCSIRSTQCSSVGTQWISSFGYTSRGTQLRYSDLSAQCYSRSV